MMEMPLNDNKEMIRCSICNKVVPKQQYCPKCGKLLIKNFKNTQSKAETADTQKSSLENPVKVATTSPMEQLDKLRQKIRNSENVRKEIIENEPINNDLLSGEKADGVRIEGENPMVRNTESKDIVIEEGESEAIHFDSIEGKNFSFKPDKYTVETVQKIAKNVKYMSYLVNLLKEDEIAEDTFLGLYTGIADDTHKMIVRRGELIEEIEEAIKGYSSTISSAQQGMKLLNIRKSIDDASDEEYKVKAAALKWDIDNYGRRINDEEQKADYLKNLGSLIDSDELDKLTNDVHNSTNTLVKLDIKDSVKDKIQDSMQEALTLLKETSGT